jgi:hypothetical protein
MSVIRSIVEEAGKFEMCTGKPPTKLYIGHHTLSEARAECGRYTTYFIKYDGRAQIYGLDVYEVDAEEHLAVGF